MFAKRSRRSRCARFLPVLLLSLAIPGVGPVLGAPAAAAATTTTAWQNGGFSLDTANVVRRADMVLGKPNTAPGQFVPLGNGTLGAAVWAAGGFTAQLNRSDTFPDRKSPGQLVIPGLSKLTGASDFTGYLDAYDGMLHESGGGMTLTAYVRSDTAQLVVDVTGADPNSSQTAQIKLWSGRSPSAQASGSTATLAETWVDNSGQGASGQTFGSLLGLSAGGRNVSASTPDSLTGQVAFTPNADGSFRVIVAAPGWTGGNALTTANSVINGDTTKAASALTSAHLAWWHNYWSTAGLIKITSADGSGEYVENLRTLYLYDAAAERGGSVPGSQAGVADLFNFSQDHQDWFPAGYWFWNLRMQVQANISAGESSLNDPVLNLYTSNVNNIAAWTTAKVPGTQGLCVPETMRFNGNGTYNGGEGGASCDSTISPTYNSLTYTSGAEIGLWIWQEYLATDNLSLLSTNYPLISGAAKFLLSVATTGSDGLLHTQANAHETQWNVKDPVTDIVAMQALFPVAVKAAQTLGVDSALVTQLNAAIPKIPPLPRTDTATQTQLLTASADSAGADMIALSAQPTVARSNSENLGLEAVWPYNLIGDSGTLTDLAKRTYTSRSYVNSNDWSNDPLQAARLGLASEVKNDLLAATKSYQAYPSGLASFTGTSAQEPYIEQSGVLAASVSEALVQDYDGLLRIAPAWPSDWTGEGTVYIQHNTKVDVQVSGGTATTVGIVSGSNSPITVRSPWPGKAVTVVDGSTGATVLASQSNASFTIAAQTGKSYLVEQTSAPTTALPFAGIGGSPASAARHLGSVSIGLDGTATTPGGSVISLKAHANGKYVTADNAGAAPLIANRTAIGSWESFDEIDLGGGNIALKSHANGQYVCADSAGASPLIANRTSVGPWETFALIHNGDGSVSLRSQADNEYVTAESAGADPLIANRTGIGPWEEFDLVND
ncbi:fascin domain-containing protein [Streptacidiphilus sp. PAMC 29251]